MNPYAPKPGETVWHRPYGSDTWHRATVTHQCGNDDALALISDYGVVTFAIHGTSQGSWATADELAHAHRLGTLQR